MSRSEDIDILRRATAGDRDAMGELVAKYQRAVRGYVARAAPDALTADDIAQEVFLAAIRGVERIDPETGVLPYLLGIARNMVRSEWRRRFRDAKLRENAAKAFCGVQDLARAEINADASDVRLEPLKECLARLAPKVRELILRHYRDELRCSEIAGEFRMETSSVRGALTRARAALRTCVESKLGEAYA